MRQPQSSGMQEGLPERAQQRLLRAEGLWDVSAEGAVQRLHKRPARQADEVLPGPAQLLLNALPQGLGSSCSASKAC